MIEFPTVYKVIDITRVEAPASGEADEGQAALTVIVYGSGSDAEVLRYLFPGKESGHGRPPISNWIRCRVSRLADLICPVLTRLAQPRARPTRRESWPNE